MKTIPSTTNPSKNVITLSPKKKSSTSIPSSSKTNATTDIKDMMKTAPSTTNTNANSDKKEMVKTYNSDDATKISAEPTSSTMSTNSDDATPTMSDEFKAELSKLEVLRKRYERREIELVDRVVTSGSVGFLEDEQPEKGSEVQDDCLKELLVGVNKAAVDQLVEGTFP
eukprot:10051492-Ditylum_brightwellii.AAC.1